MYVLALLAADDNESGSGAAGLVQIGILLLIPLAMYFLMIRPQRRRLRDQQAMQSSLEIGDEVLTNAGIYGFITGFEDDVVWVEIDDDVQIRVNRGFLQGKTTTAGAAATTAPGATSPGRVTPTVKGVKADKADKADQAVTASDPADADAAERTTRE